MFVYWKNVSNYLRVQAKVWYRKSFSLRKADIYETDGIVNDLSVSMYRLNLAPMQVRMITPPLVLR